MLNLIVLKTSIIIIYQKVAARTGKVYDHAVKNKTLTFVEKVMKIHQTGRLVG